jgi:hypothetical protein
MFCNFKGDSTIYLCDSTYSIFLCGDFTLILRESVPINTFWGFKWGCAGDVDSTISRVWFTFFV